MDSILSWLLLADIQCGACVAEHACWRASDVTPALSFACAAPWHRIDTCHGRWTVG